MNKDFTRNHSIKSFNGSFGIGGSTRAGPCIQKAKIVYKNIEQNTAKQQKIQK